MLHVHPQDEIVTATLVVRNLESLRLMSLVRQCVLTTSLHAFAGATMKDVPPVGSKKLSIPWAENNKAPPRGQCLVDIKVSIAYLMVIFFVVRRPSAESV